MLTALARDLVDNAIRYRPRNAFVKIAVAGQHSHLQLKVEDSGPGMTEQEMLRFGKRFFRVLGSGQGGSELGWPIVRRMRPCIRYRSGLARLPRAAHVRSKLIGPVSGINTSTGAVF